jgi:hypothetical protein
MPHFWDEYVVPKYCPNCGAPYPWTQTKLLAAKELLEEIGSLSKEDKETLSLSIDDIFNNTPNAEVAAIRFKRILGGVLKKGGQIAAEKLYKYAVDVGSEVVIKILNG